MAEVVDFMAYKERKSSSPTIQPSPNNIIDSTYLIFVLAEERLLNLLSSVKTDHTTGVDLFASHRLDLEELNKCLNVFVTCAWIHNELLEGRDELELREAIEYVTGQMLSP